MAEPIMDFINSPMGWITLASVGAIVGMFAYEMFIRRDDGFRPTELEDIVIDDLSEKVSKHGVHESVSVRKGLSMLGTLSKFQEVQVADRDAQTGKILHDEDGEQVTTQRFMIVVSPKSAFGRLAWKAARLVGKGAKMEDIYVLPKDSIDVTDALEIDESIQLTKFAGVWISKDRPSYDIVEEVAMKEIMEDNLQRDANWIKQMNWKDREHSKALQRMEKESSLKTQFFQQRTDSAVGPE